MDRASASRALVNGLPSERERAARWFRQHGTSSDLVALTRHVRLEPVAQVRRVLGQAIERIESSPSAPVVQQQEAAATSESDLLSDIGPVIVHELEPALGLLRIASFDEVPDYEASRTRQAIDFLERQFGAVVKLASANPAAVRPERLNLQETIASIVEAQDDPRIEIEVETDEIWVVTDRELLGVILQNAIRNALEADTRTDAVVQVILSKLPGSFRVTIANDVSMKSDEIVSKRSGRTARGRGRGFGLLIIRRSAAVLGMAVDLQVETSTAVFTLTGALDD